MVALREDAPMFPPDEIFDNGLCAQMGPELFESDLLGDVNAAKRACGMCPVREECLEWAIETRQRYGTWGGVSEHPRRQMIIERYRDEFVLAPEVLDEIANSPLSTHQIAKAYGISQTRAWEIRNESA